MRSLLKKTIFRGPITISIILVLIGCITFITSGIPFLDDMELKTVDLRFRMRGEKSIGDKVVLAAIDEKSLKAEGRWVWPRYILADLVTRLSEKGARVIAFDIGFFEPEGADIVNMIDDVAAMVETQGNGNKALADYLENLKYEKDNDRILVQAINDASAKVVLGYFFQINPEDAAHISQEERARHAENIKSGRYDVSHIVPGAAGNFFLIEAAAPQSNLPMISAATPYAGYFNKQTDPDGVVRKIPLLIQYQDDFFAPLALKAVGAYLDAPLSIRVSQDFGVDAVRLGDLSIPVNERGAMIINYRGGAKTYPHLPVTDILHGRISDDAIRGKIVLIGATAIGIHDDCVTPMAKVFPGPEVHLNVMDSILSKDFLYHPPWAVLFDLLIIVFGGIGLAVILKKGGPMFGGLAFAFMFGGYAWLCHYFFSQQGWILNMVYPLCIFVLVYLSTTSYKYFSEEGQKKFIREAFSKYLAPEVVQQLIESPQKLVLGGERREITAFFSDVQGFTSISERLAPEALVELLNEFLTEVTDVIFTYKGGVDKFEGDAVIAFFGAPNDLPNHAEAACLACIDIQERMVTLRENWRQQGKPLLKVRIGLFSGPAVVGNMGSRNRMDYTMMGDTVNTAARLEGVNKLYGTYTMIGEPTRQAAGKSIEVRELDAVKVVGKDTPVVIYEVVGRAGRLDEAAIQANRFYSKGLTAYRQREWEQAVEFFEKVLAIIPEDGPSLVMTARCRAYMTTPPADDWDGSFTLDNK